MWRNNNLRNDNGGYLVGNLPKQEDIIQTRSDGTTRTIKRDVHMDPGFRQLIDIVAGMNKGIKRIEQCVTADGARVYARKHKNWTADEVDFTGPNGNPDGINEVIVRDARGNIRVINGWTLRNNDNAEKKVYLKTHKPYNMDTGKKEPDGVKYNDYLNELYKVNVDPDGKSFVYANNADPEIQKHRDLKTINGRTAFRQLIFNNIYDNDGKTAIKAMLKQKYGNNTKAMAIHLARCSSGGFNDAYKELVVYRILTEFGYNNPQLLEANDPKTYKKLISKKKFKDAERELVLHYCTNPTDYEGETIKNTIVDNVTAYANLPDVSSTPIKPLKFLDSEIMYTMPKQTEAEHAKYINYRDSDQHQKYRQLATAGNDDEANNNATWKPIDGYKPYNDNDYNEQYDGDAN